MTAAAKTAAIIMAKIFILMLVIFLEIFKIN